MVITVYGHEAQGHIITIMFDQGTTGATLETMTIPAGNPQMDLSKAHPIISGWFLCTGGDLSGSSAIMTPAAETPRGSVPDALGEWCITSATTFDFYNEVAQVGIQFVTYWAAGARQY
jgi:hypothetical protein